MQHAESFRDLIVYQKARKVAQRFLDFVDLPARLALRLRRPGPSYQTGRIRGELVDGLERMGRMLPFMVDKADLIL